MDVKKIGFFILCLFLTGCAETQVVRTSNNTLLLQTSAAPACGVQGSMRVAQKMAAIETLRAGYDRYVITDGSVQNNVTSETLPGSYHSNGYVSGNANFASFSSNSYYQPGPTVFHGKNDTVFQIKMFKKGQKGYSNAISAKEILGADWEKLVETGVNTCSE